MGMDYSKKITELKATKGTLVAQAEAALDAGDAEKLTELNVKISEINNQITQTAELRKASSDAAEPEGVDPDAAPENKKKVSPFNSLGEQLRAVKLAANGVSDKRLHAVNEAQGISTGIGTDGAFAIQEDFAGIILDTAATTGDILSRVDSYTSSSASNSVRFMTCDETDVSESVYGGVQAYWASEAATVAASKPHFYETKIDLDKLMAFIYITDEAMEDMAFISGLLNNAMATAANRLLEGSVIDGDGVGKPLGILNSPNLVAVDTEKDQKEKLLFKNIARMHGRMLPRSKANAVWVMHPDMAEELPFMTLPIGTGGVPVYLPPTGATGSPYATLYGKPIIETDHMAAVGQEGDIGLFDMKQYMLLRKGTVKQDMSIHVEFLTAQNCFRLQLRAGGAPKGKNPIRLKHSTILRSPFVVLNARG
ncbi:phage major capsid protein [Agathobaculum sp. NTUH-O15-33]|uniref:phage major capsid protein n=1 Tax=Agathobaculum sp. NTUH-O15-33 TaxID=3079302 RepID=UPI002958BE5A|nr:phage major capsid protein [Agathobaculum sp. NTUH-O15-33]WNX85781.1 phage major capsid protein [Agathobaculum sp. NTUH-O15-33]